MAAMNMRVQIALQDPASNSFGYRPRSGIAGPYSSPIFILLFSLFGDPHRPLPPIPGPSSQFCCPPGAISHHASVTLSVPLRTVVLKMKQEVESMATLGVGKVLRIARVPEVTLICDSMLCHLRPSD